MQDSSVHRVPCGPGNIGYDEPVFSNQLIDKRGFTHIRPAHYGYPRPVVILLVSNDILEMLYHLVQKLAYALLSRSRYRYRISDAETVKLIYIIYLALEIVYLVHAQDYRLFAAP